jgi:ankyrin repeat protein
VKRIELALMVLVAGCCCRKAEELLDAVKAGDHESLHALLLSGEDANARDSHGATLLHWAVVKGDTNTVALLIRAGASLEARDDYGATAILQSAKCGDLLCAQRLLDAGASPSVIDEMGWGIVHWGTASAGVRDLSSVEAWLRFAAEQGLDLNQTDLRGLTTFDWANIHGHKEIAGLLKSVGGVTGEESRRRQAMNGAEGKGN